MDVRSFTDVHLLASIMKKIRILLILIGFAHIVQGQSLDSDIFWLAIESESAGKGGVISPLNGFAFNFGKKESNLTHIFSDSIGTMPLKVMRKKIKSGKDLFGKIIHQDKDSLILIVDENMRVKFVPLKPEDKIKGTVDFWNHTDWTIHGDNFTQHFRLLDQPWKWKSDDPAKICLITTVRKNYKNSHTEKWNLKIIGGNHLFIKTYGQVEKDIYLVKEYLKDAVVLRSLSYNQNPQELKLMKIPSLSLKDRKDIEQKIKGHRWIGAELIKKASSFEEEASNGRSISGFYARDTLLFQKKSLTNKGLSFSFLTNSKYEIYESDSLRLSGNWKISDTGQQIVLNLGCNPEDYIDLIELSPNNFTIGKLDRFQVGDRKRDYIVYYYKLKLEK